MAYTGEPFPQGLEKFVEFSVNYVVGIEGLSTGLELPLPLVTALVSKEDIFVDTWTTLGSAVTSPANSTAKRVLVRDHRKWLRKWHNEYVRSNHLLTETMRTQLGLHNPKIPGPIYVGDALVGFELFPKGIRMVGIKCWDDASARKKITYGMSGIVAIFAYSDAPITDITQLTESALLTTCYHTFTGTDAQRGTWLSVCLCWQSETGERGNWSQILSTLVP